MKKNYITPFIVTRVIKHIQIIATSVTIQKGEGAGSHVAESKLINFVDNSTDYKDTWSED